MTKSAQSQSRKNDQSEKGSWLTNGMQLGLCSSALASTTIMHHAPQKAASS
jgi:hypothetical protein